MSADDATTRSLLTGLLRDVALTFALECSRRFTGIEVARVLDAAAERSEQRADDPALDAELADLRGDL